VWYDGMGHEDQGKCSCLLFSYKQSAIWRTYPVLTTYVDLMFHFSSAWHRMMMRETIGVVKGHGIYVWLWVIFAVNGCFEIFFIVQGSAGTDCLSNLSTILFLAFPLCTQEQGILLDSIGTCGGGADVPAGREPDIGGDGQ